MERRVRSGNDLPAHVDSTQSALRSIMLRAATGEKLSDAERTLLDAARADARARPDSPYAKVTETRHDSAADRAQRQDNQARYEALRQSAIDKLDAKKPLTREEHDLMQNEQGVIGEARRRQLRRSRIERAR